MVFLSGAKQMFSAILLFNFISSQYIIDISLNASTEKELNLLFTLVSNQKFTQKILLDMGKPL